MFTCNSVVLRFCIMFNKFVTALVLLAETTLVASVPTPQYDTTTAAGLLGCGLLKAAYPSLTSFPKSSSYNNRTIGQYSSFNIHLATLRSSQKSGPKRVCCTRYVSLNLAQQTTSLERSRSSQKPRRDSPFVEEDICLILEHRVSLMAYSLLWHK